MAADTVQLVTKMEDAQATPVASVTRYSFRLSDGETLLLSDSEDYSGAGVYEVFDISITADGKEYLWGAGHVIRLNEQNTQPQNTHIREHIAATYKDYEIVEHDVKRVDFPMPTKTKWILSKLNA